MLVDSTNIAELGTTPYEYSATLEDVEDYLAPCRR